VSTEQTQRWEPQPADETVLADNEPLLTVLEEWEHRSARGEDVPVETLCQHDPGLLGSLRSAIDRLRRLTPLLEVGEPSSRSPAPDTPKLRGFEFAHCLGRGAFGEVWLAHDLNLQAARAIKLLPRQRLTDAAQLQLMEEARRMALLPKHQHRVQVHTLYPGVTNSFLVMEYVDGGPLSSQTSPAQPMTWERAARYVAEVGEALADLHAAGLLHRDLKPSNILWDRHNDKVLLADYGISALAGRSGLAGTVGYLAPELDGGVATTSSDIFALTATFFCLVTGRPPFPVDVFGNLTTARQGLARPVESLRHIPAAVQDLILEGLEPEPARRPELSAFVARLRALHLQGLASRLRQLARPAPSVRLQVDLAAARELDLDFQAIARMTADAGRDQEESDPVALRTGDLVRLEANASADGYLTVLSFGSSGRMQMMFPNPLAPDSYTPAGRVRQLTLKLKPPAGSEDIAVIWTRRPGNSAVTAWVRSLETGRGPAVAAMGVMRDLVFVTQETASVPADALTALLISLVHEGEGP
jgi:serine/threonine protein kinase